MRHMAAPGVVTISNLCNKSVYTEKAVEGRGSVCRLQRGARPKRFEPHRIGGEKIGLPTDCGVHIFEENRYEKSSFESNNSYPRAFRVGGRLDGASAGDPHLGV